LVQESTPKNLLTNGCLRGLCLSQFTALVGTFALYFASMALVEEITHSSTQVGLMIFSSTLPGFIFGLIAGPFVDRHDRITVIKWGCILRVPIGIGFALAMYALPHSRAFILAIYLCNFLLSALAQFVISAEASVIPRFVTKEQLLGANSLFNLSSVISQGTGIVIVAPALLKIGGPVLVGLVSSFFFILSWGAVARLPRVGPAPREEAPKVKNGLASAFSEMKEGWAFIAKDRFVWLAVLQTVFLSMSSLVVYTLAPGFANRILGREVADIAFAAVPAGAGFVGGLMFISSRWGLKLSRQAWSCVGVFLFGGALLAFALLSMVDGMHLAWALLAMVTAGFGYSLVIVTARTILQERPSPSMRGRIISTQMVLINAASTLPMPLAGGLADLWGIQQVLLVIALIVLSVAGLSSYYVYKTRAEVKSEMPPAAEV